MSTKDEQNQYSHGNYSNIGFYQHDIEVSLHSKHSLRLVGGRKPNAGSTEAWAKHEVIGLVKYAPAAIRLYRMAYNDNPYVDEALLKLEKRIEEAEIFLNEKTDYLDGILNKVKTNVVIQVVKSTKPFTFKPNFGGNPYANKGLLILAAYDNMMNLMETCRASGLIKRKAANDLEYHGGRVVKRVFICPGEYIECDVSREDITNNNKKAQLVISERGTPKSNVQLKVDMPEFGPNCNDDIDAETDAVLKALDKISEI
jgi:integrating conjugative element protein (TIGR03761 family)